MQSINYFEKPYRTNWFWSMYVYMQMHSKSLEENPLNWGVKNSGSGVGNDFCFYTINAIFWFICFLIITYLGIISEILNAVKHVKSPLQCLAQVGLHETLVHDPFEGNVSKTGLALPDVLLGISGSGQGDVALCLLAACPLPTPFPSWHGFYGDKGPLVILLPEHQDLPLPSWQVAVTMLSPGWEQEPLAWADVVAMEIALC